MTNIYEIKISHHYDELIKDSSCYEALRKSEGFYLSEIAEDVEESMEIMKAQENYFVKKFGNFYYSLLLVYLGMILSASNLTPSHKIHVA